MGAIALALLLAAAPIPPLSGPVVDAAGLLDAGARRALGDLAASARGAEGGSGVQLQYLVVRTLEGEPIEDYAIRVAEAWKLGTKGKDNGVLVVVALEDRAVRIEVGGGIEGGLTDAQAGRIIRGTIVPAFRAKRYGEGLYQAGVQVLSALGAVPEGGVAARRAPPQGRLPMSALVIGLLLFLVVLRIAGAFGPRRSIVGRRGGGWWMGGPLGGGFGGGGGGGFGGGGWGGGGGGFSGGGASGQW